MERPKWRVLPWPSVLDTILRRDDGLSLMPIGLFDDFIYELQETTIAPGMMLTLYTDGLTEAFNAQEQQFGRERFVQLIRRCGGIAPKELVDTAITEVQHFAINTEQSDDLTLLVVCYKPAVKAG